MANTIVWDESGEKKFETGTDHGVLYIPTAGVYDKAYAWNGLTGVTESPSGADANAQYADNVKYMNILSAEEFKATVTAYTYPLEFEQCDGTAEIAPGVAIGQQERKTFGLSYRTKIGNDTDGQNHGYKLHFIYGALAAPSEKGYKTVNDSPEPIEFSWEMSTTPVSVTGHKPTALVTIDSTAADPVKLAALETILYGDGTTAGRLPLPDELATLMATA